MLIYAIADLHLSMAADKPMDIFGEAWSRHPERIERAWRETVQDDDVVLIPGDVSWAMHLQDALPDLAFIDALPGKKLLLRGNHDYWWSSVSKVRAALPPSIRAIQNDAADLHGVVVGGTRGWLCPGSAQFASADRKIYERELQRLELSLSAMAKFSGEKILMLHYPPFCERQRASEMTRRIEDAGITRVLYGHLHGAARLSAFEGVQNGVTYELVSADHLGFCPKRIL